MPDTRKTTRPITRLLVKYEYIVDAVERDTIIPIKAAVDCCKKPNTELAVPEKSLCLSSAQVMIDGYIIACNSCKNNIEEIMKKLSIFSR